MSYLDKLFKRKVKGPPPQPQPFGPAAQGPQARIVATLNWDGTLQVKVQSRCLYRYQADGSPVYAEMERVVTSVASDLSIYLRGLLKEHQSGVSQDAQLAAAAGLLVSARRQEI